MLITFIISKKKSYTLPDGGEKPILRYSENKNIKACLFKGNTVYCIRNCVPCGPIFTLCPHHRMKNNKIIPLLEPSYPRVPKNIKHMPFKCALSKDVFKATGTPIHDQMDIPQFDSIHEWHRRPLNVLVSKKEPIRINVVLMAVGKDLTGGPLSIIRFLNAVLRQTDFETRIINIDGGGLTGKEIKNILPKYSNTEEYTSRGEWAHNALSPKSPAIAVNPKDFFMSTVYFTSLICHETLKNPKLFQKNFLYFIQDFEPIFFPQGSDYMEALETYSLPHFAVYSTPFLERYFLQEKLGQYRFLPNTSSARKYSYSSEPAIQSRALVDIKSLQNPERTRKVIVYARKHADRNAYDLTIRTLSQAVCAGVFNENWEIIGTGALQDYSEFLGTSCGKRLQMKIKMNIPEPEYKNIVRSGDIGFSLMISPHPSLPPFDFARAGLIAVTNTFKTKTEESFKNVSSNFVTAEPYSDKLVEALKKAVQLSRNYDARIRGALEMRWESDWNGEKCYGTLLMRKILQWSEKNGYLW